MCGVEAQQSLYLMSRGAGQLIVAGDDVIVGGDHRLFNVGDDRRLFRNDRTDVTHHVIDFDDVSLNDLYLFFYCKLFFVLADQQVVVSHHHLSSKWQVRWGDVSGALFTVAPSVG